MTDGTHPSVCVIIAAWNAAATVGRAVESALAQREVSEVLVIDDASPDATAAAASAADDGSGRLKVLRQAQNGGPSIARNRALAESRADYIAILDADDFYLPGRFAALLAHTEWDAIADDIVFVPEARAAQFDASAVRQGTTGRHDLTFDRFIAGNIPQRGRSRGELGFLKPVVSRAFLDRHSLRYDETLRLGEDFDLYARMLAAGARFVVVDRCGYVAVERAESLSGLHSTNDLAALLAADDALLGFPELNADESAVLRRHRAQLLANWRHRRFLDDRRAGGLARALTHAIGSPLGLGVTAWRIARDKLARPPAATVTPGLRYLLNDPPAA